MNHNFKQYLYTDMASELYRSAQSDRSHPVHPTGNPLHDSGIDYSERNFDGIRGEKLVIADDQASAVIGKSIGTYYTVHTGDLRLLSEAQYSACQRAIRASLLDAAVQLCPDFKIPIDRFKNNEINDRPADYGFDKGSVIPTVIDDPGNDAWNRKSVSPEWDLEGHLYNAPPAVIIDPTEDHGIRAEGEPFADPDAERSAVTDIPTTSPSDMTPARPMTILAVGLGNPALTPDALGPMCVSRLHVTRHLSDTLGTDTHRLCAITPLVLGQTGIETLELVQGAVRAVQPDLVILIDALAASELDTLTQTVQISTTGIHPGGGVGNKRQSLDRDSLDVPVMTVGVPTVIAASTLVCRALDAADLLSETALADNTHKARWNRVFAAADIGYVAPKDIDASVAEYARLLADAINELTLGTDLAASVHSRI